MATTAASDEPALSVSDVRARLRQAVLRTELRPDSLHSQDELRASLGVGRTPFREALRMVQAEGLIEILSSGRLKIPALSMDNFAQIQIARIAMESAAARLTIPQLGPDDLARLEGYMGQMSHYFSTDHFDRIETPHLSFHRGLVSGAGPEMLVRIIDLNDRAGRYRWAFPDSLRSHWTLRTAEHRAILDAAIAGDGEEVAVRLSRHYLDAGAALTGTMKDPEGHERFEEMVLTSLAPTVRAAVRDLKPKSRRAASAKA